MPTVIDRATGEVVQEFNYDDSGQKMAQDMVDANPMYAIANDATYRSNTSYEGGDSVQNKQENIQDPYNMNTNFTKNG